MAHGMIGQGRPRDGPSAEFFSMQEWQGEKDNYQKPIKGREGLSQDPEKDKSLSVSIIMFCHSSSESMSAHVVAAAIPACGLGLRRQA